MRWKGGEQSENLEDRRGMGGKGIAIGGGGLLLVLILSLVFGIDPQQLLGPGGVGANPNAPAEERELTAEEKEQREFMATILRFTEVVWDQQFKRAGETYQPPRMVLFSNQVQTGCGVATSQVGPFYCPRDQLVYIDLDFFDELQSRFGAGGAPFAQAYVIAHEYGHHVQNQLGVLNRIGNDRQGPESAAVRSELQADCYGGVWAANAVRQGLLEELTQQDINEALDAASAIGDDRIQEKTQGQVNPESWTHGSAEQRRRWFSRGYEEARPAACDTFSGSI